MQKKRKYNYYAMGGQPTRMTGLGPINEGYGAQWNSKVSGKLQRLGIANLAYYSEWTAPKLKHYEQPTEPEQRLKVYQFEDEGRVCHRCEKVKSGCFYSPIRGTEMRSVSGILKALARTTLCILCANREMPTVDGQS